MIKGFGYFSLFVFLIVCSQIGGFQPGFSIWFLSVLLVGSGTFAFGLLQLPIEIQNGAINHLLVFSEVNTQKLIQDFEMLSGTIRKEGLLSIEGLRKDLKDPFLRYLLKRVVGGFEKAQIVSIIHNRFLRTQELFTIGHTYFERMLQAIPVVGLIGSLFQIMEFLASGKGSISVVFIPFVFALLVQQILQSLFLEKMVRSLDGARVYHLVLEEGIGGIQDGINAELLKDKLQARLLDHVNWTE